MNQKLLTKAVAIRMDPKTHTAFHRKAQKYGKPSEILRELIGAFVDDRLVITPNPKKESLYHVK